METLLFSCEVNNIKLALVKKDNKKYIIKDSRQSVMDNNVIYLKEMVAIETFNKKMEEIRR